jgi:hypothetical protein
MDKLIELRNHWQKIRERITQLEYELKKPLSNDFEEDAQEEQSREVIYGIYQVEKDNLARIEAEIREEA